MNVNIDQFQHNFLQYLQRVEAGETVVISRDDEPIAVLIPADKHLRPYGLAEGEFVVPDDFDDSLPEDILADFGAG